MNPRRTLLIGAVVAMMLLLFVAPASAGGPPEEAGLWDHNGHLVGALPTLTPDEAMVINSFFFSGPPTPTPMPAGAVLSNPHVVGDLPIPFD